MGTKAPLEITLGMEKAPLCVMQVSPKICVVLVTLVDAAELSPPDFCYFIPPRQLASAVKSVKALPIAGTTCRSGEERMRYMMVLCCKLMQDRIVALTARFTTALSRVELM